MLNHLLLLYIIINYHIKLNLYLKLRILLLISFNTTLDTLFQL